MENCELFSFFLIINSNKYSLPNYKNFASANIFLRK